MPENNEITLKEVILKAGAAKRYLLRRWRIVLLGCFLGGVAGFCLSFFKKPEYVGTLTFVLEDTKTSSLGAYSGLASQFGIDLGGMGGSGIFSGDNILEFLKSRLMVERGLVTDTIWGGNRVTLADLYMTTYRWREKWPKLAGVSFPPGLQPVGFSRLQDSVMDLIYTVVLEKNLFVDKPDKKLSFIDVSTTSTNDFFSKLFTERLVRAATDFYIRTKTQRLQQNVDRLQSQADSILNLLNKTTFSAALNQDLNLNPARKVATVGLELASRDKTILGAMYTEVAKNLELAKISLSEQTPVIQIVDTPRFPVEKKKNSLLKSIALGLILGVVLTMTGLVVIRIYRVIMQ